MKSARPVDPAAPDLPARVKVAYSVLFVFGLIFSYAPLMPVGIACGGILLFQRRSVKFNVMGAIVFALQVVVLFVFLDMSTGIDQISISG